MRSKLAIFDVCHTIVDTDSTRFYVDFLKSIGYGKVWILKLIQSKIFFLISSVINKLSGYNIHRRLTFWLFKGINAEELKKSDSLFLEKYIKKVNPLFEKLIEYRDAGEKVVLISASINLPIEILGKYIGVETYSSKLIEKGGTYSGKVEYDLLGQKEYIFKKGNIRISNFSETIFYTDNLDDIGLIKYINLNSEKTKFFLVINIEKNRIKWKKILYDNKILNYEFIS